MCMYEFNSKDLVTELTNYEILNTLPTFSEIKH